MHTPNVTTSGAMTLKSGFLLVVMAVLASWKLCAADAVRGRYRLRSLVTGLEVDPAAQKRLGSLTFLNKADINSTKVLSKLQQMAPSVQCGDNLMTLAVKRTGAPPFLVDSGQAPLVPLSQMPHYCGFSMKRSRRDIQYSTPYRGCYVNKQDGDYVLPLRLMGEPMAMSCPTTLPMPYIFCFPSRMLVRMAGVSANEFKVKMSGTWQPLLSAHSCGLTFQELNGELVILAPYRKASCIETKDDEYRLSLQWADFELLATCPPVEHTDIDKGTNAIPRDTDVVMQQPPYTFLPMYSQYGQHQSTHNQPRLVQLPQPQLPILTADSPESPKESLAQQPPFNFLQLPPFFYFPPPELPAQAPGKENSAAPQIQVPPMLQSPPIQVPPMLQSSPIQMSPMLQSSPIQMPPMLQSSQYKFPMFPQFPMMPEISQPTPSSAPTTTKALVTTPPPSTEPKGKHEVPRHPQFPLLPQYPFLPISKPSSPKSDATNDPNIAQPVKPQHQLHPSFSFPVLYPPLDPHSSRQLQQTRTPASPAEVTKEPPAQESFYQPHPLMPLYLIPKQAPVPLFLNPSDNPAQSQPFYPAMPHMYSFIPEQRQVQLARSW
uniref:ZP domain-containing protein n=1 Tax=Oryzias latipes TaxID=8090 RepID=A0A3P9JZY3_ORYLA